MSWMTGRNGRGILLMIGWYRLAFPTFQTTHMLYHLLILRRALFINKEGIAHHAVFPLSTQHDLQETFFRQMC